MDRPMTYANTSPQMKKVIETFPDGFFTTAEVADLIGLKQYTVQRWRLDGVLKPTHFHRTGKTLVWFYDQSALNKAFDLAQDRKPGGGRPRKRKPEEEEAG